MIRGKLGSDVGQPEIQADETRVSHTYPSGSCGRPWYDQLFGVFLKQLIISGFEIERNMVSNKLQKTLINHEMFFIELLTFESDKTYKTAIKH